MNALFSMAASGLQTAARSLQVVANNVANLGTDGFGRSALQRQAQPDGGVYGKSITDPCLGWEKTERLILEIADLR